MKADDMTKCSMIASYHQMTNARSGLWHHFHGDPLFGQVAGGNSRDDMADHPAGEPEPEQPGSEVGPFDRILRLIGWHDLK